MIEQTSNPDLKPALDAVSPVAESHQIRSLWTGPNGLRAGWRLLIFAIFLAILGFAASAAARAIFGPSRHNLSIGDRPSILIASEGLSFLLFLIPTCIMSRLERRPLGVYGLAFNSGALRRLAEGGLWGFVALSTVLLIMRVSGFFYFGPFAGFGKQTLVLGFLWGVGFLLVGFVEEYAFRGYTQYTLTSGLGFWLATLITSSLFLVAHMGNKGETPLGLASVFFAGVLLAVALWRTGSLWFAIGIHLGWDWAQSFFYGVPDSGLITKGHLFEGTAHGPAWLSGGTTGPEGSLFALLVQLAIIPVLIWRFRTINYPDKQSLPKQPGALI